MHVTDPRFVTASWSGVHRRLLNFILPCSELALQHFQVKPTSACMNKMRRSKIEA
jgi:hypothetical protein